jgi:phage nucleotide-binding protein
MLKIKKSTDEVKVERLKTLIYAPPGTGKTSLAFTASKPLLLDFDNGAYRAGNRQDVVEITNWADVSSISAEDLKPYDTIVIDTAGRMLDIMSIHLTQNDKAAIKRDGSLSLQGFGKLKAMFDSFMAKLIGMQKDVVLIAHEKEVRVSEELTTVRPDIQGSSFQIVKRSMDLIGYLHVDNQTRILNFNPNERTLGKNSAGLPMLEIPDISRSEFDTCLADMLIRAKDYINQQAKSGRSFYEYKRRISNAKLPEDFDAISAEIGASKEEGLKKMVRVLVSERIRDLGIEYDKDAKKFVLKTVEAQV